MDMHQSELYSGILLGIGVITLLKSVPKRRGRIAECLGPRRAFKRPVRSHAALAASNQ